MSQELLDHTEVGAALQEVRGEGVTEGVGTDATLGREAPDVQAQEAVDATTGQPRAAIVDEQWITGRSPGHAPHAAICARTASFCVLRCAFRAFGSSFFALR